MDTAKLGQCDRQTTPYTLILGGIGGDSHSVGLTILHRALVAEGYRVIYLGIQNQLPDFFAVAHQADAVMISNMDGHARHYLRQFRELKQQHTAHQPRWYLGGNLSVYDDPQCEEFFRRQGFDRVCAGFTDLTRVLAMLAEDLATLQPVGGELSKRDELCPHHGPAIRASRIPPRMDDAQFERAREKVLKTWPTGSGAADLADNAAFLNTQPLLAALQGEVLAGRRGMLIQPRSGHPSLEQQTELFQAFKAAGAPVLSYQVDSFTRNNNYTGAAVAISDSAATGKTSLNGFPVVNHGVDGLRRIIREVGVPMQTRHSTRDPRLLAEVSYAGGVSAFEGGAICYNIPYYKDYSLADSIRTWSYVDRLTGEYHKRFGIVLDREYFGVLTATLIPPSLAIVTNILECLLAAQEGVRCVSVGYAEQGHRVQDIAAMQVMGELTREVLAERGFADVQVNTVFHQYMAAFPLDVERAESLIRHSAMTAALSGATRVLIKTAAEARKIPSAQANVEAINLVAAGVQQASELRGRLDTIRIAQEAAIIRRESRAIFDAVMAAGADNVALGIIEAFRTGLLDVPFSPNIYNAGAVMTARDVEGAVRYLNVGRLPFDKEIRDFNRGLMQQRRGSEPIIGQSDCLLVEHDVMQIARGQYEQWPLCDAITTPAAATAA